MLSEEHRTNWKYFSRFIAFIGAIFATKTGNLYIDSIIVAFTAAFLVIVIETQRTYSKLKPSYRKRCIRIAMSLGSWGVAVFGAAIFAHASIASAASVFSSEVMPALNNGSDPLVKLLTFAVFLVAFPVAVLRSFRELCFEELIYRLPRNGLKQLLVYKRPKAMSFPMFAYMEMSALLVCLVYASSVAELVNTTMTIVRL
ncbi:MAG: hypothetical protein ACOH2B_13840 [Burkholderiaceae bacterium]